MPATPPSSRSTVARTCGLACNGKATCTAPRAAKLRKAAHCAARCRAMLSRRCKVATTRRGTGGGRAAAISAASRASRSRRAQPCKASTTVLPVTWMRSGATFRAQAGRGEFGRRECRSAARVTTRRLNSSARRVETATAQTGFDVGEGGVRRRRRDRRRAWYWYRLAPTHAEGAGYACARQCHEQRSEGPARSAVPSVHPPPVGGTGGGVNPVRDPGRPAPASAGQMLTACAHVHVDIAAARKPAITGASLIASGACRERREYAVGVGS